MYLNKDSNLISDPSGCSLDPLSILKYTKCNDAVCVELLRLNITVSQVTDPEIKISLRVLL